LKWEKEWQREWAVVLCESTGVLDTFYMTREEEGDLLDTLSSGEIINHPYSLGYNFKTLSVVGPYVSYEAQVIGYGGGAHPINDVSFEVVRFDTKKQGSLTEIFSEDEIMQALLSDEWFTSHLSNKSPKSLYDLIGTLNDSCAQSFYRMLNSFAYNNAEGDTVTITFCLTDGCDWNRGGTIERPVRFHIPVQYKGMFEAARKNRTLEVE
jgi:hypothetical protein